MAVCGKLDWKHNRSSGSYSAVLWSVIRQFEAFFEAGGHDYR